MPDRFVQRLTEKPDDAEWHFQVGVEQAIGQVQELIDQNAEGLHFYVLNKSPATMEILTKIEMPWLTRVEF